MDKQRIFWALILFTAGLFSMQYCRYEPFHLHSMTPIISLSTNNCTCDKVSGVEEKNISDEKKMTTKETARHRGDCRHSVFPAHICSNQRPFPSLKDVVWCANLRVVLNTNSGGFFYYPDPSSKLCDKYLCNYMMRQGYVDISQNTFFQYIKKYAKLYDLPGHIVDVGAHLGEYMPSAIVNGISYSAIEGSPDLASYMRSMVIENNLIVLGDEVLPCNQNKIGESKKIAENLFHGYFSDREMGICLQTSSHRYKFITLVSQNQHCTSGKRLQIQRYDLSYIKKKKCDEREKFLAVKYDVMINLCSVADQEYFGDLFEYEYVIKKYRKEFGFGFPECLKPSFWANYELIHSSLEINNAYAIPNEKNTKNGGYNHALFKLRKLETVCS